MRLTSEVTMKNDESLDVDFAFGELALEDTRAVSAGGITKLIRNKTGAKSKIFEGFVRFYCVCWSLRIGVNQCSASLFFYQFTDLWNLEIYLRDR